MGIFETIQVTIMMFQALTNIPFAVDGVKTPTGASQIEIPVQTRSLKIQKSTPVTATPKARPSRKIPSGLSRTSHILTVLSPNLELEDFSKIRKATLFEMAGRY